MMRGVSRLSSVLPLSYARCMTLTGLLKLRRQWLSSTSSNNCYHDLGSKLSVEVQKREHNLLAMFEVDYRESIKKMQKLVTRCYNHVAVEGATASTFGPYEYYNNSPDEEGSLCDPVIYRRSRTSFPPPVVSCDVLSEELVLDVNRLRKGIPEMIAVTRMKPSMDNNLLAFSVHADNTCKTSQTSGGLGSRSIFCIKDLRRNIITTLDLSKAVGYSAGVSDEVTSSYPSIVDFEWATDTAGGSVLYVVLDDNLYRPYLVLHFDVTANENELFPPDIKQLQRSIPAMITFALEKHHLIEVMREDDVAFNVNVGRSKDDKYVIIGTNSKVSSGVSVVPIPVPVHASLKEGISAGSPPTNLFPRQKGFKYFVDHCEDHFYVATNRPFTRSSVPPAAVLHPSTVMPHTCMVEERDRDLSMIRCMSSEVMRRCESEGESEVISSDAHWCPFELWDTVYPVNSKKDEVSHFDDFDLFTERLIVYGRIGGFPSVKVMDIKKQSHSEVCSDVDVVAPGPSCQIRLPLTDLTEQIRGEMGSPMFRISVGNNAFDSDTASFSASSPIVPEKHFTIDLKTNSMHVTSTNQDHERSKNSAVEVDLGQYIMTTETVEYVDGMPLLLTIVSKLKSKIPSPTHTLHIHSVSRTPVPFVLIGYGAYGIPVPVEFDPQVMALLESGFSVGYAHCRGGGELGAAWHAAGKGMLKSNTFKDFTACARYLIAGGYTSPSQLCGMGTSAGGLIMGYVANQKEQLFAALIMRHPFLDPFETLQRAELPLTVHEYDEFGHPDSILDLENIRSYSPCSNIKGRGQVAMTGRDEVDEEEEIVYPAMFLSTCLQDTKVGAWESIQWVQSIRNIITHKTQPSGDVEHFPSPSPGGLKSRGRTGPRSAPTRKQSRVDREYPLLLHITKHGDHNGPSDPTEDCRLKAMEIVFLQNALKHRK